MNLNNHAYTVDLRKPVHCRASVESAETVVAAHEVEVLPASTPIGARLLAFLLLIALLITPFTRVYANEGEAPTAEAAVVESVPAEPTPPQEIVPVASETPATEVVPDSEVVVENESESETASSEVPAESVQDSTSGAEDENSVSGEGSDDSESAEVVHVGEEDPAEDGDVSTDTIKTNEETQTGSDTEGEVLGESTETTGEEGAEIQESSEEAVPETPVEPTTEEVTKEEVVPAETQETETNTFSRNGSEIIFDSKDCVAVSEEEFYCLKKRPVEAGATHRFSASATQDSERAVYAQKDGDGDLEIYLMEEGVAKKITDNVIDDDAPSYDPKTGRVAWHALSNDRYQIFVYDHSIGATRQVTNAETNQTNPSIDGDMVVWQGWEDDNWEVFSARITSDLFSGISAEVTRVTSDARADMFPKLSNGFIAWQARIGEAWKTQGLNTATGEVVDLGDGTGGDVSSTRMVLLVERRNENGELERFGYEIETGESIELGTEAQEETPAPLPQTPIDGNSGVLPETASTTTLKTAVRADGETDTDTDTDAESDAEVPVL